MDPAQSSSAASIVGCELGDSARRFQSCIRSVSSLRPKTYQFCQTYSTYEHQFRHCVLKQDSNMAQYVLE